MTPILLDNGPGRSTVIAWVRDWIDGLIPSAGGVEFLDDPVLWVQAVIVEFIWSIVVGVVGFIGDALRAFLNALGAAGRPFMTVGSTIAETLQIPVRVVISVGVVIDALGPFALPVAALIAALVGWGSVELGSRLFRRFII